MSSIIITDEAKLREIIQEEVSRAIPEKASPQNEVDTLTLEKALLFLREQGYPVSKAKVYKLTSTNEIPYKKFGQKLVFSKKDLLQWAENSTRIKNDKAEIIQTLAQSAGRKR